MEGPMADAWSKEDKQISFQETPDFEKNFEEPKKEKSKFSKIFDSTFKSTGEDHGREVFIRSTLRELVIYSLLIVILSIITVGPMFKTRYYNTKGLSDLFTEAPYPETKYTFNTATHVRHIWRYMENMMIDGLYWESWYDTNSTPTEPEDRNILYEAYVLGLPRMRQVRVKNNSCDIHEDFQHAIRECYSVYSHSAVETEAFGLKTGDAWTYHYADETESEEYPAEIGTYEGGGYIALLGKDANETKHIISDLKKNLWIDRATRALFIDFTIYNTNVNLFCVIKLVFELPATGGVIPSSSFQTLKLIRYVSTFDYFVMGCEFVYVLFMIFYIIQEIVEIKRQKLGYLKKFQNYINVTVIVLSLFCIIFSICSTFTISNKLASILLVPDSYANFEALGDAHNGYDIAIALLVFLSWLKLLKYISFSKTTKQLTTTITRSSRDVGGFTVIFVIVFAAYAQLGFLIFGTQVYDFHTFSKSCFTLFRTILGDFNFHDIEEANRILGPAFFITYVFFVFFVLINMFLAIINDTYCEVKAEIAAQRSQFEITDYLKRGYNNVLGKAGRRNKLLDFENALKLSKTNSDGVLTFGELRYQMKKFNFSDMEIEMFFARCDMNNDEALDVDEVSAMLKDLDGQQQNDIEKIHVTGISETKPVDDSSSEMKPVEPVSHVRCATKNEFTSLQYRVDRMEHTLGSIVTRIDTVLLKMDNLEKAKSKKRESLDRILND